MNVQNLRKTLTLAANLKHKNPWSNDLRIIHKKSLKEFKVLCRAKKAQFWHKEIETLNGVNTSDNFWDKWRNMGENEKGSPSFPENTDGQKWEDHFKNLLTEK